MSPILFVLILHFAGPPPLVMPAVMFDQQAACEATAQAVRQAEPRVQAYCVKRHST